MAGGAAATTAAAAIYATTTAARLDLHSKRATGDAVSADVADLRRPAVLYLEPTAFPTQRTVNADTKEAPALAPLSFSQRDRPKGRIGNWALIVRRYLATIQPPRLSGRGEISLESLRLPSSAPTPILAKIASALVEQV